MPPPLLFCAKKPSPVDFCNDFREHARTRVNFRKLKRLLFSSLFYKTIFPQGYQLQITAKSNLAIQFNSLLFTDTKTFFFLALYYLKTCQKNIVADF